MTGRDEHLERLAAREEIRELPFRYSRALERRDVDAMVALFSPEARFGDLGTGPEAVRDLTRASLEGTQLIVILVANHLIDLTSADEATGEVWAWCCAHTDDDGYVEQLLRYDDRYVRVDGSWKFLHRRHRMWFGTAPRPSPLDQAPADWPRRQVGVGDLPLGDPVFGEWYRGGRGRV